jgi:hypothetical protein
MNPDTTTPNLDLSWNDWHSLNPTDGKLSTIPTSAGLYRIRHHHRSGLEYIGQTGRSLRGWIGALAKNTYNEEMPYRDPHTAAPCLWAIRQEDGPVFSVSCVVPSNASMDRKRKGLEAALIAIYRKETGESPTANFGRIIPSYRQSSSRRVGRVGGPLSDDQVETNTERGVEPLTWVHYQELDHLIRTIRRNRYPSGGSNLPTSFILCGPGRPLSTAAGRSVTPTGTNRSPM